MKGRAMKMAKERFLLSKPLQKIASVHTYIHDTMTKSQSSLYSMYRNISFRLGVFSMENRKIEGIEEK